MAHHSAMIKTRIAEIQVLNWYQLVEKVGIDFELKPHNINMSAGGVKKCIAYQQLATPKARHSHYI